MGASSNDTDTSATNVVIKAAKKSLRRQDSGSMKIKALAKEVVEKLSKKSDQTANVKDVRKVISSSKKFALDGKLVSLASKRERGSDSEEPLQKKARTSPVQGETQSSLTPDFVSQWRKEHKIVLKGCNKDHDDASVNSRVEFHPSISFEACSQGESTISPALLRQCTVGNGFLKPSPIQAQCWPILLAKRDVVGIAETGSGKTLAFALPALTAMQTNQNKKRRLPRMLVLAPTRELAMQSQEVLQEFGSVVNMKSLVVYGGVPKHTQTTELKRGTVDCIVATPGRLKDLIYEGSCDLSQVHHLVLDEADRMLDMGFEEDVRDILSHCKSKEDGRQTAMFSATWPAAIQKIAMDYMVDPLRVYVGFEAIVGSNGENAIDDSLSANKRVAQTVEVIEDRARDSRLRKLLNQYHAKRNNRVLVFCLYKKEAERMEHSLRRDGWNCCSIHGNKNQAARTLALAQFKDGSCPLLIATDVAARGLDIPNVEVVINFTFPLTIEDYVHRIGRTGRAGKNGISHTFFQPSDKSHAGELQQVMKQAGQNVPDELLKFGSTIKKKEHKLYGNFGPRGGSGEPMKKATKITFDHSDDEE